MYTDKLKKIRKTLGLSQMEIAEQTGTSYRAYASYERGDRKPSFEFLQMLVKKYNVNLNCLLADIGELFLYNFKKDTECVAFKDEILSAVRQMLKDEGILK